jgi:hypothetical protein
MNPSDCPPGAECTIYPDPWAFKQGSEVASLGTVGALAAAVIGAMNGSVVTATSQTGIAGNDNTDDAQDPNGGATKQTSIETVFVTGYKNGIPNYPIIPMLWNKLMPYLNRSGNTLSGPVRLLCQIGNRCSQIRDELNAAYNSTYSNGYALKLQFALTDDLNNFDVKIVSGSCARATALACAVGANGPAVTDTINATGLYYGQPNVFNHEFAHILGFQHSGSSTNLMYWQYSYENNPGLFGWGAYDSSRLNMRDATRLIDEYPTH